MRDFVLWPAYVGTCMPQAVYLRATASFKRYEVMALLLHNQFPAGLFIVSVPLTTRTFPRRMLMRFVAWQRPGLSRRDVILWMRSSWLVGGPALIRLLVFIWPISILSRMAGSD